MAAGSCLALRALIKIPATKWLALAVMRIALAESTFAASYRALRAAARASSQGKSWTSTLLRTGAAEEALTALTARGTSRKLYPRWANSGVPKIFTVY